MVASVLASVLAKVASGAAKGYIFLFMNLVRS